MYYDGIIIKPSLNELYHHGIKGQKWGVRNGPPYPLKSHSGSEKKAKPSSNKGSIHKKKQEHIGFIDPVSAVILSVYAAAGVATLAAYLVEKHKKRVQFIEARERTRHIDELRQGAAVDSSTGLHLKKDKNMSMDEDMAAVNYDRGVKSETRYSYTNCAFCTTAYDLRRRGFEVSAGGDQTQSGVSKDEIASWYKDGKFSEFTFDTGESGEYDSAKVIKEELLKQPNGARGNLCVRWPFGGGHSVVYEVVNNNLVVLDTQSNERYEGSKLDEFLGETALVDWSGYTAGYMRTDNLEPDYEALKRKGIIR